VGEISTAAARCGTAGADFYQGLSRPAILASAASTLDLYTVYDCFNNRSCSADSHFESYLSSWQADGGILSTSNPLPPKQSFWDKPGIMSARDLVESSYSEPQQRARFLAAASPHRGDWLLALPTKACGLQLSDEAVRVAVALRLGCSVCVLELCAAAAAPPPPTACRRRAGAVFMTCSRHVVHQLYVARFL